ncbi:hypothetical protein [Shewanella marisflavi]|uniref:hypothetical protein n=1 Tax=Shewanella marisflavi TaxID=260364 RepID=UPI003AAE7A1B
MSTTDNDNCLDTLNLLNSWPFAFSFTLAVGAIVIFQSSWDFIAGLYFPHAYDAVVLPLLMYLIWNLNISVQGGNVNRTKLISLMIAFLALFLPTFYLILTDQVDIHTAIFGEYDPTLEHLPYAGILPYIFLGILLAPIKDITVKKLVGLKH